MRKYIIGIIVMIVLILIIVMDVYVSLAEQVKDSPQAYSDITVRVIQRTAGLSDVINFPNPFNPKSSNNDLKMTTFAYVLTENSKVTINIYNIIGDLVRKLEFASGSEGGIGASGGYTNRVTWDGRNGDEMIVANGVYIAQIIAEPTSGGETSKTIRKIAVVK